MKKKWVKVVPVVLIGILALVGNSTVLAAEEEIEKTNDQVQHLDDMVVKEKIGAPGVVLEPQKTEIDLKKYQAPGVSGSVTDVLKTQAIVDFRGDSDLSPGVDDIYLRGFDAKRFVTSIDGITVQKTGGRKSSNIVDYSLLPAFMIDKIDILPGPHSALYDSKSIGGVIDLIPARPKKFESLKPEVDLTTSYRSYNTQVHSATVKGMLDVFTYDLGYQKSKTDGYLRHNTSDIDNLFGRVGMLLPGDGFVAVSTAYSDVDRQPAVNNTDSNADYDDTYPDTEGGLFDPEDDPTWNGVASNYRLNYEQAVPVVGRVNFGAYYSEENRDRTYYANPDDTERSSLETFWVQQGGKIKDDIQWAENHTTTVGVDFAQMYDDGINDEKTERINKKGSFLQHRWDISRVLDLKLGVRYENVTIWVSNWSGSRLYIPNRDISIERSWEQWVPKSFATWKMDHLAPWLRDTSLSAGVSKIWRAPDYHGDYNPQGRPAGAWLEPEHGMGYDLVFNRRLWGNFDFKVNYAFYDIKDFIATNRTYAEASDFSDYKINLEEVYRHGVDLQLGGNLTETLSVYLSYAWQTFENQGDERAGETELHQRAENRLSAGLRYSPVERTTLMLDYYYQSEETTENYDEYQDEFGNVTGYSFNETHNNAYNLVDVGVSRTLLVSAGFIRDMTVKLYIKNLFDETYYDTTGFPATDRTYGVSLSLKI